MGCWGGACREIRRDCGWTWVWRWNVVVDKLDHEMISLRAGSWVAPSRCDGHVGGRADGERAHARPTCERRGPISHRQGISGKHLDEIKVDCANGEGESLDERPKARKFIAVMGPRRFDNSNELYVGASQQVGRCARPPTVWVGVSVPCRHGPGHLLPGAFAVLCAMELAPSDVPSGAAAVFRIFGQD